MRLSTAHSLAIFSRLSNWRLYFFNNDPAGLIPTSERISTYVAATAISNTKSNSHFPCWNPTTVALYVGWPVGVDTGTRVVQGSINGGWIAAFFAVEREEPSSTTA